MIRYMALLTATLLLTVSCSGGSEPETAQVSTSAPTATAAPIPTATTAPIPTDTATPAPTQVPPTSKPTRTAPAVKPVKVCDWASSYTIQDGFIYLTAEEAPNNQNIQNLAMEFIPNRKGARHPIFNETGGFALHEYSQERLDISKNEQQVAIPKAKTAYRMDLKVVLAGSTIDGRNCQQELHEAFTRSDDYYPSPLLSLPDNAQPNLQRYAEYLANIPQPNAQSVFLATSMGDWNGNWDTMAVHKLEKPIRIGFYGDVGLSLIHI